MDYYVADEKMIIHQDGWMFFVRDSEEGVIELGYREMVGGVMEVIGDPLRVSVEMAAPLAKVIQYFAERNERDKVGSEELQGRSWC